MGTTISCTQRHHAWEWRSTNLIQPPSSPVTIQFSLWLHIIDRTARSCACLSKAIPTNPTFNTMPLGNDPRIALVIL
jgi:hypothetical protein